MLEEINKFLETRMSAHIDSRCATEEDVMLAWCSIELTAATQRIKELEEALYEVAHLEFEPLSTTDGDCAKKAWTLAKQALKETP